MALPAALDENEIDTPNPQGERPYISSKREALKTWDNQSIATDLIARHVDEFEGLVVAFTDPQASKLRREFAYGRLFGARGTLCRLCPNAATELLPNPVHKKWQRAENTLRTYLENSADNEQLLEVIERVEEKWTSSAEAYLDALMIRMKDAEVEAQLGLLKSIDSVALHLGQREIFRKTKTLNLPIVHAHELKLRVRLIALYIMIHSSVFDSSLSVIKGYRETFRISDPAAYPWWFVDYRLNDKQLLWTYRRLSGDDLAWRF